MLSEHRTVYEIKMISYNREEYKMFILKHFNNSVIIIISVIIIEK